MPITDDPTRQHMNDALASSRMLGCALLYCLTVVTAGILGWLLFA